LPDSSISSNEVPLFTLRLGLQAIEVVLDREMEDWGEYSGTPTPKITVNSTKSPGFQLTLLHELLHVIDDAYDIGLSEQDVRILEQSLANFVHDNPKQALAWFSILTRSPKNAHEAH
jgi:hypothetical protein